MIIFITGCSGYIGSILSAKLSSEFFIIAGSQKKIVNKNRKIKFKKVDYKSLNSLKKNFKGADAVIHLVGMNKEECEKKRKKSLTFKEEVTLNILKACEHNKIKKLIYLSSSQIYKDFQKNLINEKSKKDTGNYYSKGHILAENKILNGPVKNFTIIRASNIFGFIDVKNKGEQKKNLVHMFCEEAVKKNRIEIHNPNVIKNFLPISTLVNKIKAILRSKKFDKKIMNLGSKSFTLHLLAHKIQNRLNLKKKKIKILTKGQIKIQNQKHYFTSLLKKNTFSKKNFDFEIDNIINLQKKS